MGASLGDLQGSEPESRPSPPASPLTAVADLLCASAQGDEGAFAELYTLAAPRLFGMALRVLGQRDHAEEATQEAFFIIWNTCRRFDRDQGSAWGWMLTIAHRRAVDHVRRVQGATRRDAVWAGDQWRQLQAVAARDATADAVHASIQAATVRAALGDLSPQHRAAIVLAYFGGQTHAEVAASLGIPHGTAKTRIRDGLRALGKALG